MAFSSLDRLRYRVGGLLYCPAVNAGIADKIARGAIPKLMSLAICLEDSICDEALPEAEDRLCDTLQAIRSRNIPEEEMPPLFVRIRTPEHMRHMHARLEPFYDIVTGYILPKFDLSNGNAYRDLIKSINGRRNRPVFIMPILESRMIADISGRTEVLLKIRDILDSIRPFVLNVRVGGNDFCNLYGLRRAADQNIYQIGVVRDILTDILNVFAGDYVVSGPVWEYFGADPCGGWAKGLREELKLDRLNGFIGKTAIHPSQLPLIYESMQVSRADYEDALRILNWQGGAAGVERSADGSRMNELKCHGKWAKRIVTLGEIYGIREA